MYEVFKFTHVAAAILWVGGAAFVGLLMGRLEKAGDGPALSGVSTQMEWFSKALFMPVALLALLSGIAMVVTSDGAIAFETPWVAVGMAGFLVSMGIGMGVLAPATRKLKAAIAAEGPQSAEAARLRGRVKGGSMANELLLWLVVLDMVVKPGA